MGRVEGLQEGVQMGRVEGLQEGVQMGRVEGLQEGKIDMAKNLLARGVSPDVIADSSGLSRSDIQSLIAREKDGE
jgi:predicted transposase/invertase (TIGR01784 family)